MKLWKSSVLTALGATALATASLLAGPPACSAVQAAGQEFDKVVTVVLADANAGDTEAKMEADACAALGGSALTDTVCVGVADLVASVLSYLIDKGALAPSGQSTARAVLAARAAGISGDAGAGVRGP